MLLNLDITKDLTEALKADCESFAKNVSAYIDYAALLIPDSAEYEQSKKDKDAAIEDSKKSSEDRDAAIAKDVADQVIIAQLQAQLATSQANLQQALASVENKNTLLNGLLSKANIPVVAPVVAPAMPSAPEVIALA